MRWFVAVLCLGVLWGTGGCGKGGTASGPSALGELDFRKDSTCTDITNTELFIDATSQGQFTMRAGSVVGFTKSAGTHLAQAIERAGALRQFPSTPVAVPANGIGTYTMSCATKPPPGAVPIRAPGR